MITVKPSPSSNPPTDTPVTTPLESSPTEPQDRPAAAPPSPGSADVAATVSLPIIRPQDPARWGSLPMAPVLTGLPVELEKRIPLFEKMDPHLLGLAEDSYSDMVVRVPAPDGRPAAVGLVSKSYQLIQHREVFRLTVEAAGKVSGAVLDGVTMQLTQNGARMMTRVDLGPHFAVGPDNSPVKLHLTSFNSVDGGAALLVRLGWYRLICSNGLAVGLTVNKSRLSHIPGASMEDVFAVLKDQLAVAARDRETMLDWARVGVGDNRLREWIDGPLCERWNTLSAARVWHICRSGHDAGFVPPFEKQPPTRRNARLLGRVPGSIIPAANLYAIAQAMSWVASRRSDIEEARAAQGQIAELMGLLRN